LDSTDYRATMLLIIRGGDVFPTIEKHGRLQLFPLDLS
jgi:hypothetical protein